MNVAKTTLLEFCKNSNFSDSEDDSEDEESPTIIVEKHPNIEDTGKDNEKISIIIDSLERETNDSNSKDHISEWDYIELVELEDFSADLSFGNDATKIKKS